MHFRAELVLGFLTILARRILCEEYNLFGLPGLGYLVQVNIGSPQQTLNVLVDTGSSTLAVASKPSPEVSQYFHTDNSTTLENTSKEVHAQYTLGEWSGDLASDLVRFPSLAEIPEVNSQLVLISNAKNFFMNGSGWQGILGLAYPVLAQSVSDTPDSSWLEALEEIRGVPVTFALMLCGVYSATNATHYGKFSLLDNNTETNNDVFCTPVLKEGWYEIGVLAVRVLDETNSMEMASNVSFKNNTEDMAYDLNENMCQTLNKEKSIVDSGTTNIRLPEAIFRQVVDELKMASQAAGILILDEFWYRGEAACWPEPRAWHLPRLALDLLSMGTDDHYFTIALPPQNYMRLVSVRASGGNGTFTEYCYKLGVEAGLDTVLGVAAMEGLQVVFNRSSSDICWRPADCGYAPLISGPHKTSKSIRQQCALIKPHKKVTPSSIRAAQWAVLAALNVAISLLIYLAAPCARGCFLRRYRLARARLSNADSRTALVTE